MSEVRDNSDGPKEIKLSEFYRRLPHRLKEIEPYDVEAGLERFTHWTHEQERDVPTSDPEVPATSVHSDEGVPTTHQAAHDEEFSLFYMEQMPRLVAFLAAQGTGLPLATDIAQEAMAAAYRSWESLDVPKAWVRVVALRSWRKAAIQQRTKSPLERVPTSSGLLSAAQATEIEQRHTLLALLATLPPAQREVLAWTFDGYGPTEIADLLGKTPATVRSLLRQARAALQAPRLMTPQEVSMDLPETPFEEEYGVLVAELLRELAQV